MKEETKQLIAAVLKMDSTVSQAQRTAILRYGCAASPARKMINAKEVCQLLDISRGTLRQYVKNGVIEQIYLSPRKVRFDAAQIQDLATNGVSKGVIGGK